MALTSTLYRFTVQLADVDRGLYDSLELRVARHPSEAPPFLLTRVIAYCLNVQEGLELTRGIDTPEEPALWVKDLTGQLLLWIEVGNPSARKLHKAAKASRAVRVYTYRDPDILLKELAGQEIHHRETIEVFSVPTKFLTSLGETLERENKWELLHTGGELTIAARGVSVHGEIRAHRL